MTCITNAGKWRMHGKVFNNMFLGMTSLGNATGNVLISNIYVVAGLVTGFSEKMLNDNEWQGV